MRTGIAISLALCSVVLLFAQDDQPFKASLDRLRATQNLLDTITLPQEKQDPLTKSAVTQLAASAVPLVQDASRLAVDAITVAQGPGLDMRDGWKVTALFRLANSVPTFGAEGDLIWEVRVHRDNGTIIRVLWVSTTTKAVRELVPSLLPRDK